MHHIVLFRLRVWYTPYYFHTPSTLRHVRVHQPDEYPLGSTSFKHSFVAFATARCAIIKTLLQDKPFDHHLGFWMSSRGRNQPPRTNRVVSQRCTAVPGSRGQTNGANRKHLNVSSALIFIGEKLGHSRAAPHPDHLCVQSSPKAITDRAVSRFVGSGRSIYILQLSGRRPLQRRPRATRGGFHPPQEIHGVPRADRFAKQTRRKRRGDCLSCVSRPSPSFSGYFCGRYMKKKKWIPPQREARATSKQQARCPFQWRDERRWSGSGWGQPSCTTCGSKPKRNLENTKTALSASLPARTSLHRH